jgi:hypothetical protein
VLQDEHGALQNLADLIEGHIDAAAAGRIHCGARLALTAILSHFLELEPGLELVGSGYNADIIEGQLEAFWTRTRQASESLSSRVPLSTAHSPPDGARGGLVVVIVEPSLYCRIWDSNYLAWYKIQR